MKKQLTHDQIQSIRHDLQHKDLHKKDMQDLCGELLNQLDASLKQHNPDRPPVQSNAVQVLQAERQRLFDLARTPAASKTGESIDANSKVAMLDQLLMQIEPVNQ